MLYYALYCIDENCLELIIMYGSLCAQHDAVLVLTVRGSSVFTDLVSGSYRVRANAKMADKTTTKREWFTIIVT